MTVNGIAPDMSSASGAASAFASPAAPVRRSAAAASGEEAMRAIARDNLAALTGTGQELVARAKTLDTEIGPALGAYSGPHRSATRNMRMVSALFSRSV